MKDILAVLVLYKTTLEDSISFRTLVMSLLHINQEITLLVYDNSPVQKERLPIFIYNKLTIYYIADKGNSGLSFAYNSAYKLAIELKKKFLLLLDQDSHLPIEYCRVLLASIEEHHNENIFVPLLTERGVNLSPCFFRYYKGWAWKNPSFGINQVYNKSFFNSCICISLSAFEKSGCYDERIPLDFSDHYFVSLYKKKYQTFVLLPIKVKHSLSSFSTDKAKLITRFKIYCKATKTFASLNKKGMRYLLFWNLLRAVKLSFKFKDCIFLIVLFKDYIFYEAKN